MRKDKWDMYIDGLQGHPSACQSSHTLEKMSFIKEFISPNKFPKLLNIGAGEGVETYILHHLGYDVVGLINGKNNMEYAHKNFPEITFVESDMHDLPFLSNSFNAVYMNHTFEHAFAPFIFLLELYCVLKPEGRVWITMPDFREITDPTIGEDGKIGFHHPNILCPNLFGQFFNTTGFKMLNINNFNVDGISVNNLDNNSGKHEVSEGGIKNMYLLEKQCMDCLHLDVRNAIKKRKEVFG